MRGTRFVIATFVGLMALPCVAAPEGDCNAFTWDMTHELALFAEAGKPLSSGAHSKDAPRIEVDTLYLLDLHPLSDVVFAHAPAKTFAPEASSGGVVVVRVATQGRYRITLDSPLWADVVNAGQLLESNAFQGQKPCHLIHKSVEWSLPANIDLIIQLTGTARERTKLAVTRAPNP